MDLPMLLRQHKTGDLADPFREPMGVAHSGWTPHVEEEEEEAAVATAPAATATAAPAAEVPDVVPPAEAQPDAPGQATEGEG
jgi:hypothetical protein